MIQLLVRQLDLFVEFCVTWYFLLPRIRLDVMLLMKTTSPNKLQIMRMCIITCIGENIHQGNKILMNMNFLFETTVKDNSLSTCQQPLVALLTCGTAYSLCHLVSRRTKSHNSFPDEGNRLLKC